MTTVFDQRALPDRRPADSVPQWFASVDHAWQAMSAPPRATPNPTRSVRSATLAGAVDLVTEALYRPGPSGQRQVPSAGAIFPYVTMVLARDDRSGADQPWRLVQVTADGRVLQLPADPDALARVAAELAVPELPDAAHVLLLTRPWMSIRKYGPRGYLYTSLDAAHAGTNLLGLGLAGGGAQLRLTAGAQTAAQLLCGTAPYHELFAVLTVQPGRSRPEVLVEQAETGAVGDAARHLEAICWSLLGDFARRGADPVRPTTWTPMLEVTDRRGALDVAQWPALSGRRRSAKRFRPARFEPAELRSALSALGTALPVDLSDPTSSIAVTLFAPGLVAVTPALQADFDPFTRLVAGGGSISPATLTSAFMGQAHLLTAQAFVLLHADRRTLLGAGRRRFDDAVFRAGAAGQLIYLGASRAGLGVSAVGGFDAPGVMSLAAVPADHELIYVVALGAEDSAPQLEKLDRAAIARSHGEQ